MILRENICDQITKMTKEQRIFWAQDNGFFVRYNTCDYCNTIMRLVFCKRSTDGYKWQCCNYLCVNYKTYKSLRKDGCFENFSLDLCTIVKFCFYWAQGIQQFEIIKLLTISRSVCLKFENFFCEKIKVYFERYPIRLGGFNRFCQIDESKLNFNVKSHVGRGPREQIWCFGIADTTTTPSLGFCCVVSDRTANTLLPIIARVCRPGTTIVSDEWAAYNNIQNRLGFSHFKVCHKENFVNPVSLLHTQNIESYWNKLKLVIKKMKGIKKNKHEDFLNVFMWRERIVGCEWEKMSELIKL
jgi:transposase-like protein